MTTSTSAPRGLKDTIIGRYSKTPTVYADYSVDYGKRTGVFKAPAQLSQTAVQILATKYAYKAQVPSATIPDPCDTALPDCVLRRRVPAPDATFGAETSAAQIYTRLAAFWARAYYDQYDTTVAEAVEFFDYLMFLLENQYFAPNSPQWFNAGVFHCYGVRPTPRLFRPGPSGTAHPCDEAPQTSACFILSVEDDLCGPDGIMDLFAREAAVFKGGSGSGVNYSRIRGKGEKLSGGGRSSGLKSFLRVGDRAAGAIKSGGTTRRSARMVVVDIDHPDVKDIIRWKVEEEDKVGFLVAGSQRIIGLAGCLRDAFARFPGQDPRFDRAVRWAISQGLPARLAQRIVELLRQGRTHEFEAMTTGWEDEAYSSVSGQNANNSVRLSAAFMQQVVGDGPWTFKERTTGQHSQPVSARELMNEIATAAWICADPGVQFDDTINQWHVCPSSGKINATNPCVTGDTLVATSEGWVRIDQMLEPPSQGAQPWSVVVDGEARSIAPAFKTGHKPVYCITTKMGRSLRLTGDHKVWTANRGDVPACELTNGDLLVLEGAGFGSGSLPADMALLVGLMLGDGCISQGCATLSLNPQHGAIAVEAAATINGWREAFSDHTRQPACARDVQGVWRVTSSAACVLSELGKWAELDAGSASKRLSLDAMRLDEASISSILRGLFTTDGTVANYGDKSKYVSLDSCSLGLLEQVQLLLLSFGIRAKIYRNRRGVGETEALMPDGKGGTKAYPVQQVHSLRISKRDRVSFEQKIGFHPASYKATLLAELNGNGTTYASDRYDRVVSIDACGTQDVYDLTEPQTNHFVANGIRVHNCSEYCFLDNTACNLASINLVKFLLPGRRFDFESFESVCRTVTTVLELTIDASGYPTEELAANTGIYRTLGMGYMNLGALLMRLGMPYGGPQALEVTRALTGLMTMEAWGQSARMAHLRGVFSGLGPDRPVLERVVGYHLAALIREGDPIDRPGVSFAGLTCPPERLSAQTKDDTATAPYVDRAAARAYYNYDLVKQHGARNAQVTVIAPTGTISFACDCDTTGIEPDFSLIKYKQLAGGGYLQYANASILPCLEALGFPQDAAVDAVNYVLARGTLAGFRHPDVEPGLVGRALEALACAQAPDDQTPTVSVKAHLDMLAAAQPVISGALSKTVNMPPETTIDDVRAAYMDSYHMGLKAVAIYRGGSKFSEPMASGHGVWSSQAAEPVTLPSWIEEGYDSATAAPPVRERLPSTRTSRTYALSVGGLPFYLTTGEYADGRLGEIFITVADEGSALSGMARTLAKQTSLMLQHRVPLETVIHSLEGGSYDPSGFVTGGTSVRMASSLTDCIARHLRDVYLRPKDEGRELPEPLMYRDPVTAQAPTQSRFTGERCSACNSFALQRAGSCLVCQKCGTTTGCS